MGLVSVQLIGRVRYGKILQCSKVGYGDLPTSVLSDYKTWYGHGNK